MHGEQLNDCQAASVHNLHNLDQPYNKNFKVEGLQLKLIQDSGSFVQYIFNKPIYNME